MTDPLDPNEEPLPLDVLIPRLLAADGREQKTLLKAVLPRVGPEHLEQLAPLVRASSPRVSSRVTALLAKAGRRDLFEQVLGGLKAGKVTAVRAQFDRIAKSGDHDDA